MTGMHNLSTRLKLVIALCVMMFFLVVVTIIGLLSMNAINRSKDAMVDLTGLTNNVNLQRVAVLTLMTSTAEKDRDTWRQVLDQTTNENGDILTKGIPQFFRGPREAGTLKELAATMAEFNDVRRMDVLPLINSGKIEEARKISLGKQGDRYKTIRDDATKLKAVAEGEAANQLYWARIIFLACIGIALLAALVMIWWLERVIALPLREVTGLAGQIASGDLDVDLSTTNGRKDEVGQLTTEFSRMVRSLNKTARIAEQISQGDLTVKVTPQSERDVLGNAFAAMVQKLRGLMAEITQGVNVLGASAGEIVASTSQVASSATQTATAVTETTATVEEIKQTAQVANQKARDVADIAQRSAQFSQEGRQAVEDTVEGTQHIRQQMDSIAESIIKLSEQSQTIGVIIDSVNELAEQSNLLAVNAAIQAAQAGEHGKGFGVVAQEVKSLAEQSKGATAQVRSILSDIQKATSAAVMATEQGSKAVESALGLSAQAGQSIGFLADSIGESAQSATQIAASGQQQLVGMDQVAMAMQNINDASLQNVSAMEQLKSAAQNLNDLGQGLKQVMEQYRV